MSAKRKNLNLLEKLRLGLIKDSKAKEIWLVGFNVYIVFQAHGGMNIFHPSWVNTPV